MAESQIDALPACPAGESEPALDQVTGLPGQLAASVSADHLRFESRSFGQGNGLGERSRRDDDLKISLEKLIG